MPTIAACPRKVIATPPFHKRPSMLARSMGCRRSVCQEVTPMASHTFLSARARWLLLDSRGVDFTRAYHAIFASRPLLEVIIFQGPYEGFGRFRRTVEQKTLESLKSQHAYHYPPRWLSRRRRLVRAGTA